LKYAKPMIVRKIIEQGRTLRYFAKTKRMKWLREASYELEKLSADASSAGSPEALRAVEAQAARLYCCPRPSRSSRGGSTRAATRTTPP